MHASFYGKDLDADLNNLLCAIDNVKNHIVFSPACEPGITGSDGMYIALQCLAQNVQQLLSNVEFTER